MNDELETIVDASRRPASAVRPDTPENGGPVASVVYVIAKAVLYLLLIALCILLSPDQPVQFIYTEF